MDTRGILSDIFDALFRSPLTFLLLTVILGVFLVAGLVILQVLHLLTGVVIGLTLLVFVWVLAKTKILPTHDYPWLGAILAFIPIIGFTSGIIIDSAGIYRVVPMLQKPQSFTPFYASTPITFLQGNIEFFILIFVVICAVVFFAYHEHKK